MVEQAASQAAYEGSIPFARSSRFIQGCLHASFNSGAIDTSVRFNFHGQQEPHHGGKLQLFRHS